MFIASFFSHQGGVGRTVALLNTAWLLAERGRSVCLLDLDLHAPGLHRARLRRVGDAWKPPEVTDSLVQRLRAYKDLLDQQGLGYMTPSTIRKVLASEWLCRGLGPGGRIGLVPAFSKYDTGTPTAVEAHSWPVFYQSQGGVDFVRQLIRGIREAGFDYLLIDTRTGLSDERWITIHQVADLAVMITNLTEQSAYGMQYYAKMLREKGTPPFLMVLSPSPTGLWNERRERLMKIEGIIEEEIDVEIPLLPMLALGEEYQIVSQKFEGARSDILVDDTLRPYVRLTEKIIGYNPHAPENQVSRGHDLLSIGTWRDAIPFFEGVLSKKTPREVDDDAAVNSAQWGMSLAHLRGLNVEKVKERIEKLEKIVRASECHKDPATRRQLDQIRHETTKARLAAAWMCIVLNRFSDAREHAEGALQHARAILKETDCSAEIPTVQQSSLPPRDRALLVDAGVLLGRARELCGAFDEACESYQTAELFSNHPSMSALSRCSILCELAQAHLWRGQIEEATKSTLLAERLSGSDRQGETTGVKSLAGLLEREQDASLCEEERSPFGSLYMHGKIRLASSAVLIARGRGIDGRCHLKRALETFAEMGDDVGWLEGALSWCQWWDELPSGVDRILFLDRITSSLTPSEGWTRIANLARSLRLHRIAWRIDLLQGQRPPLLDEQQQVTIALLEEMRTQESTDRVEWDYGCEAMCYLTWCRRALANNDTKDAAHWYDYASARSRGRERTEFGDGNARESISEWVTTAVGTEYHLTGALLELAGGDLPAARSQLKSFYHLVPEDSDSVTWLARAAVVRAMVEVVDEGKFTALERTKLHQAMQKLQHPSSWNWLQPLDFVQWCAEENPLHGAWKVIKALVPVGEARTRKD
jgi:hypothetical protein